MDEPRKEPRHCISDNGRHSVKDDPETPQRPEMETPFRFLDLPAELRNTIYEFAIGGHIVRIRMVDRSVLVRCGRSTADRRKTDRVATIEQPVSPVYNLESSSPTPQDSERPIYVTAGTWSTYYPQGVSNLLNLNFVCRQVRSESSLLPYELNIFCFQAWFDIEMEELTNEQRAAITEIALLELPALRVLFSLGVPIVTELWAIPTLHGPGSFGQADLDQDHWVNVTEDVLDSSELCPKADEEHVRPEELMKVVKILHPERNVSGVHPAIRNADDDTGTNDEDDLERLYGRKSAAYRYRDHFN